ncbi:hypothetical protein ATK74_1755 [Propionicimonas paludicola]|uniref:Uncharacterized protein n=1 Tax=Propionicimonas paludicola TaxID=185243 RepID=A0A2A9CU74_9ACTN|nr:DUF6093 family protein [Propionicimonas paludicola]PFG17192.1 hypothetical protein ATK74_1755 [Propionicimonas paludicola]
MTLGAEIAAALPELRAAAISRMTDTIKATRPGATTTDPATGAVSTAGATVYEGPGRWKPATTIPSADDVATSGRVRTSGEVHLPVGAYKPLPGDVLECIGCVLDPNLIGRKTVVRSLVGGSQVTAYRIPIEGE